MRLIVASLLLFFATPGRAMPAVTPGTCHLPLAELASAPTRSLRVALVQYEIRRPRDLADWETKIHAYITDAVRQRAKLVVFPELISLEGLALLDPTGARP